MEPLWHKFRFHFVRWMVSFELTRDNHEAFYFCNHFIIQSKQHDFSNAIQSCSSFSFVLFFFFFSFSFPQWGILGELLSFTLAMVAISTPIATIESSLKGSFRASCTNAVFFFFFFPRILHASAMTYTFP